MEEWWIWYVGESSCVMKREMREACFVFDLGNNYTLIKEV